MIHAPDIYTLIYVSLLKGSRCTIASSVQASVTFDHTFAVSICGARVLMPSLRAGPLPGNPLAAFPPVQTPGRGWGRRRLLAELYIVVQLRGRKGGRRQEAVVEGAVGMLGGQRRPGYAPRLPTCPDPPCRSRLIRCRGAPAAPAPSSRTARGGSPRCGGRR